jgi:lipopolysaccharide/colanic/teichoic acid biosynthesis glycosyltransferase
MGTRRRGDTMTRISTDVPAGGRHPRDQASVTTPPRRPGTVRTRQRGVGFAIKRAIDQVGAVAALLVSSPVLAAAAIAVRVSSPGPILFRQERVGRFERPFTILKFRSMRIDADERVHREHIRSLLRQSTPPSGLPDAQAAKNVDGCGGAGRSGTFKLIDDDRITPVGRLLRMTSVDELPQLLNVVRGEMSLVGPRPDLPEVVESYEPWHHRRFDVLPGMTGLWQVSGRDALSPAEMLGLDVQYADTWTMRRDLAILLRTVPAVVEKFRRGTA